MNKKQDIIEVGKEFSFNGLKGYKITSYDPKEPTATCKSPFGIELKIGVEVLPDFLSGDRT